MKKVLVAFDGSNFSEGAFEFARRLNELEPILVTGVFMPQVEYANLWSYAAAANANVGTSYIPLIEEEESDLVKLNIERFEELSQKNGITYRVHRDFFDFALPELKKESRFTDVIILSGELFYKGVLESNRFLYLKDAIHVTESPIIIVPEKYEFPTTNVLAYDGSEESVYAIKQFAYVFPELAKNPTLLVYAQNDLAADFPSKQQIVELATQHFKDLTFYKLELNPKKFFNTWITDRKGSILISGSLSRSGISQLFKKSFVSDIIPDHKIPVFIAHK